MSKETPENVEKMTKIKSLCGSIRFNCGDFEQKIPMIGFTLAVYEVYTILIPLKISVLVANTDISLELSMKKVFKTYEGIMGIIRGFKDASV